MKKLSILFSFAVLFSGSALGGNKTVSIEEVNAGLSDPAFTSVLIDVRTPEEYAEGHIPGSINVPVANLSDYIEDLEPLDAKGVVVYCRSGRRAARAIETLQNAGFENISHMEGDMGGWYKAGLPVNTLK